MNAVERLLGLESVRNVRRQNSKLRIELFTRPVKDSDTSEIQGDLSSITQRIRHILDEEVKQWEWITRPRKRYSETEIGGVIDRKPRGYRPDYYTISLE